MRLQFQSVPTDCARALRARAASAMSTEPYVFQARRSACWRRRDEPRRAVTHEGLQRARTARRDAARCYAIRRDTTRRTQCDARKSV